ncbi:MAG: hypothetical protein NVSMB64_00520 [Candidatus Velthaea sp.]
MDDLTSLRERITSYADYADIDSRHLVDQQVRAYVGARLSAVRERLTAGGGPSDQLDRVLFRCEFTDQRMIRAGDHAAFTDAELVARIHALDRELLDAGDRAGSVEAADLPAYLTQIETLFDARFGAITGAPAR